MKNAKTTGEYKLLVHSIDGSVSIYHLDKRKFTLYTFGRGGKSSKHLSTKLPPDDLDNRGQSFLSSMQCYFAWDPEAKDWVVGNGKPLDKYIPQEAKTLFKGVSDGPTGKNNRVYVCIHNSEAHHTPFSDFQILTEPTRCSCALGIVFVNGTRLTYKGEAIPIHFGKLSPIIGCTPEKNPFAYLFEILPLTNLEDNIPVAKEKHK